MDLIAHRGLTNDYIKENTMEAYLNAIKNNYSGIELDIRKTKDNKIVCLHDKFINRTSNGVGNINNLTYRELLKYNFGSKKVKSKIPLLSDVVKSINNKIIIIELKEKINIDELENILKSNDSNDYYICSFNNKHIENIKNIKYKIGIINYIFNSGLNKNKYDFILILEDFFNEDIYNYLNKLGIEPIIYNISNNIKIKNIKITNNLKYIL